MMKGNKVLLSYCCKNQQNKNKTGTSMAYISLFVLLLAQKLYVEVNTHPQYKKKDKLPCLHMSHQLRVKVGKRRQMNKSRLRDLQALIRDISLRLDFPKVFIVLFVSDFWATETVHTLPKTLFDTRNITAGLSKTFITLCL